MPTPDRAALSGGPYRTPRVKAGHPIACLVRGEVVADGLTEGTRSTADGAPLAWPYVARVAGKRSLLLCADLVRAVRRESAAAVMASWGVSRSQVRRWRRALGVPAFNAGTVALWRALAPTRLSPASRCRGGGYHPKKERPR